MTDVRIIVVSYNTRELTLACLESVREHTRELDAEVVVVDNASTDGSAAAIREAFPEFRLLALDENLGFAAANNLAAKDADAEYLLLLNPDTVVFDDAIARLLAFAREHPDAGISGGRTVFPDGSLNPASCWRRQTLWSVFCRGVGLSSAFRQSPIFDPESYGRWRRDTVRRVDIVTGCFFLIRRDLWEQLGGFDPAFFMYGEEADLCLRARRLGARPIITPDATIVHVGGASENVRSDKVVRLFRAKARLMDRHWSRPAALLGRGFLRLNALRRYAIHGLRSIRGATPENPFRDVWRRRREWLAAEAPPSSSTHASPTLEPTP